MSVLNPLLSLAVFGMKKNIYRPLMEMFCIHEKDKVPATQEGWWRCETERLHQEPVGFVTWSKKKSRRLDWEHFRPPFERHTPSVPLELPVSKWCFKGRERGWSAPNSHPHLPLSASEALPPTLS